MNAQMRHLLLTTALVSLIAAVPLRAQTNTDTSTDTGNSAATTDAQLDNGTADMPRFAAPEGYTEFEAASLTVEDLQGATIYDADGESVGEITDFVFDTDATSTTNTANAGADGTSLTDEAASEMAGTDTGTGNATDTTAGSGLDSDVATTDGDVTNDTDITSGGDVNADTNLADDTDLTNDTDGTGTQTANDTTTDSTTTQNDITTNDTVTSDNSDASDTTTSDTTTTDTATTDTGVTGDGVTDANGDLAATGSVDGDAGQTLDVANGRITHVVLDVGGFLGIGAHTVAVPLDELQVFRDEGNDVRVYLPWTQAQLEALPEYDEDAGN